MLNAYSRPDHGTQYVDGDLAVRFAYSHGNGEKSCAKEADKYNAQWRAAFGQ